MIRNKILFWGCMAVAGFFVYQAYTSPDRITEMVDTVYALLFVMIGFDTSAIMAMDEKYDRLKALVDERLKKNGHN